MADNDQCKEANSQGWAGGIWQNIMKKFGQNPASSWILVVVAALGVILLLTGNDRGGTTNGKLPPGNSAAREDFF